MLENNFCKLLLLILWLFIYLQLNFEWKLGVLFILLINIFYQHQYRKTNKTIHKKTSQLTLGMAIHLTLLGWYLLTRHTY
tara:strand:+ start:286 stop:525 length:240 start_codon:yes stop_codon:yes gene_type:complete